MDQKLAEQYDGFVEEFLRNHEYYNQKSRAFFYEQVDSILKGKFVLDVACGDGKDINHYRKKGARVTGIDASHELVSRANELLGAESVDYGYMEKLPYTNGYFDVVLSKWAMQSSTNVPKVI